MGHRPISGRAITKIYGALKHFCSEVTQIPSIQFTWSKQVRWQSENSVGRAVYSSLTEGSSREGLGEEHFKKEDSKYFFKIIQPSYNYIEK